MAATPPQASPAPTHFWNRLTIGASIAAFLLSGWVLYSNELAHTKTRQYTTLSAIASLKAAEITAWRDTVASDAWRVANGDFLRETIEHLDDPAVQEEVQSFLRQTMGPEITAVMIFRPDGRLLLGLEEDSTANIHAEHPELTQIIKQAMESPRVFLSDLHRGEDGNIHLGAAAAVHDAEGHPVAVIVFRSDARLVLYPILESRQTASPSAESLLVRRDGDHVLYLSNLRHQSDAALSLRHPLSETSLPAVQAALGTTGVVEGTDYRGVDVLTDLRAIPDSPWKLVVKIDRKELLSEALHTTAWVTMTTGLLIVLTASLLFQLSARKQLAMARNLQEEHQHRETEEQAHLADLKMSARQLRNVLQASPVPLALTDPKGRITFLNMAFQKTIGYVREEVPTLDEWWTKAYPNPAYRQKIKDAWEAKLAQSLHTSTPATPLEAEIRCKDGRTRTISFSSAPLGPAEEGIQIVNLYDLTTHKESEKWIQQLSHIYLALSECSQAIARSVSVDELLNRICRVVVGHGGMKLAWLGLVDNSSQLIVTQVAFGEGKEYLEELTPSLAPDSPRGHGPTATCIRENRPVWCQDFARDPMTEPWHARGRDFGWGSSGTIPLRKEGKVAGALKIYSERKNAFDAETQTLLLELADNISFALDHFDHEEARVRAESELQINRDMLAKIINAAPEAIFWKDENSVYLGCNEIYARSAGLSHPGEIAGKTDFDLPWPPEETEAVRADDALVISTKNPLLHRVRVRKNADGTELWTETSKVPLVDIDGRVYGVLGIKQDITEQKNLESDLRSAMHRAEAASEAKGQFLAVMSHELRTPLTGVLGFADLLADTKLDSEQSSYVRTIRGSGDHLLHVVNDILDFSSIESGGLHLETSPFALADLIESTATIVGESAEAKGIAFRFNISSHVPPILSGDARRIRQILLNLLGNAVKFTTAGSVKLLVSLRSEEDRSEILFVIEDTGPGIPPEVEDQLFKPFAQADSTLSRRFRGTGLGLAISLRLARAMGGDITLLSSPGKGSTFTFRLPCKVVSPGTLGPKETPTDTTPEPPEPAPDRRPVLLVDDDHVSILLTGKILSGLGYTIDVATGGQAAIDAFAPEKYLAILMDMQMPGIDGIEATRRIRAVENAAGSRRVPIIAVTANVMPGDREECLEAGMNDVVTKPINRTELIEKLAKLVRAA